MTFRLLKICSTEEKFESRLEELKENFLIPRQYHAKVVDAQFNRIRNLPGNDFIERRLKALEKKEKQPVENKRIVAPLDYNPVLPKLSEVFEKHHRAMLFKKPELRDVFREPPMAAYRQPPNIRKLVCRATLPQPTRGDKLVRKTHRSAAGWKKCGKGSTTCCPFALPSTEIVVGQVTGYKHQIKDAVNCETTNCVYYWKCIKDKCKSYPRCEYVGLTSRPFRLRLVEHKQYIRSKILGKPSGGHFNQQGHELSHFAGLILEHVKSSDPFVLRAREYLFIQKFDTFRNGLNGEQ